MKLYYGRMSGNSARAVFAILESGAPHELVGLDTQKGENRAAGYLAVNPMGKVPAFEDGPLKLWESNAINYYLAEKTGRLLPKDAAARAGVLRWTYFQSAHVSPACITLFRATN